MSGATLMTLTDRDLFTDDDVVDVEDGSSDLVSYGSGSVKELDTSLQDALNGNQDSVTWSHDFDLDPDAEIVEASLTLYGYDDEGDAVLFDLEFGWLEVGDDGTLYMGEVDDGSYEFGIDGVLLEDGVLTLTVGSLFGDFTLTESLLTITYFVGLPGTLALIALPLFFLLRRHGRSGEREGAPLLARQP